MSLFKRILSFQLIGWIGTAVNLFILWLCYDLLSWPLLVSGALAIEIAIIHNFIWYYCWTWNDRVSFTIQNFFTLFVRYNIVTAAIDFVIRLGILWILTEYVGIHYLISDVVGMFIAPLLKYITNDAYIFDSEQKLASQILK